MILATSMLWFIIKAIKKQTEIRLGNLPFGRYSTKPLIRIILSQTVSFGIHPVKSTLMIPPTLIGLTTVYHL